MDTLTLAAHGRTDWQIVLPPAPSASEQYAAEELARFLHESTDADFQIVPLSGTADRHRIFLGFPLWNAPGGLNPVQRGMGKEEFYIQTLEDDLILTGGRPRGTLYAVYELLDTVLGCRWFTPDVSHIPHYDVLKVPFLSIHKEPALTYREDYNFCAFDPDWACRNRLNGSSHKLETKHGGTDRYNTFSGGAHSFDLLVPVAEYFDTHPEYFSEVDGVRIKDHTQLCLTNPEVVEISKKQVLEWIRKDPEAELIAVAQNDWYNPCTCPACRAIDEQEESHAGTLLTFVNQIAEAVAKEYPEKKLGVLAYQYTRKPPKHIKPHPNVLIRLCSIECCFSHPLEECQEVASFKKRTTSGTTFVEDLAGWARICDQIQIWDYTVDFMHYLMPFPNFQVLKPNINFFLKNHAIGIFEQGNGESPYGDFEELRAYVIARLLWDPELETDDLIREFLDAFYGAAASPLNRYIELLKHKVTDEHIHLGIYDPPTSPYWSYDILDSAEALIDEARGLVSEDPVLLARVGRVALGLEYVRMATMPKDDPARPEAVAHFFDRVEEEGILAVRECISNADLRALFEIFPEDLHYHQ